MNTETLSVKSIFHRFKRIHYSPSFNFDLSNIIGNMKLTPNWTKGELYSKILLKTPDKQIILTLVPKGTEINFIQTTDKSTFQIIEGKMNFHTNEESINLEIGQFITLRDNIKYNLTSREETVFLLTIVINSLNSIEKINNSNLIYSNNERQDNYY